MFAATIKVTRDKASGFMALDAADAVGDVSIVASAHSDFAQRIVTPRYSQSDARAEFMANVPDSPVWIQAPRDSESTWSIEEPRFKALLSTKVTREHGLLLLSG